MEQLKVTYIYHSSFLVETKKAYFLFNYYRGKVPHLDPDKPLVVLASHRHHDHYDPAIWNFRRMHPHVTYIISDDIPFDDRHRNALGLSDIKKVFQNASSGQDEPEIFRSSKTAGESSVYITPSDGKYRITLPNETELLAETFRSTDEGVAFFITYEGITLYHAGDLHLWLWDERGGDVYKRLMSNDFYDYTKKLRGRHVDAGFFLLDNRLKQNAFAGMDAYLDMMDVSYAFPMHMWEDYALTDKYLKARNDNPKSKVLQKINYEGEEFVLDIKKG